MTVEDNKRLVARAVAEVINDGDLLAVDELYPPHIAQGAKHWVAPFRAAFPDVWEVYWCTVRGGRIVDRWGLEDNDDRRRQLRGPAAPA
jgi:hypothetical protein